MTPPLLLDDFSSPIAVGASAGIYTAVRVRTLAESRATRLPIPSVCVCPDGTCTRCWLDDEAAWKRRGDE